MPPTHTWKQRERNVGIFFGLPSGRSRTPLSGGNSGGTRSDTLHPELFIEHKHRKRHACISLWEKVRDLARKEEKIPVVTLSTHGKPGFYILCHSSDLTAIAKRHKSIHTSKTNPS